MQREQFEDVLARAAAICKSQPLIIFGSQSVHAITTAPPTEVLLSVECDVWTRDLAEAASLERGLGKDSEYARAKGVYADPLPPQLPTLPSGWEQRLVPYKAGEVTAQCLEIHDLIVSKLAAGRFKDYEFIAAILLRKLGRVEEVQARIMSFQDVHTRAGLLARWRMAQEATAGI